MNPIEEDDGGCTNISDLPDQPEGEGDLEGEVEGDSGSANGSASGSTGDGKIVILQSAEQEKGSESSSSATKKVKRVSHNKLQTENAALILQVQELNKKLLQHQNSNESFSKDNQRLMQTIEEQKEKIKNLTNDTSDILRNFNAHKISSTQDKNTFANTRIHLETAIQKLQVSNTELSDTHATHLATIEDLKRKEQEYSSRYQNLTALYTRQTAELTNLKKEVQHLHDEIKLSNTNNKKLYEEIGTIKIETDHLLRSKGRGPPVSANLGRVPVVAGLTKPLPAHHTVGLPSVLATSLPVTATTTTSVLTSYDMNINSLNSHNRQLQQPFAAAAIVGSNMGGPKVSGNRGIRVTKR